MVERLSEQERGAAQDHIIALYSDTYDSCEVETFFYIRFLLMRDYCTAKRKSIIRLLTLGNWLDA